MNLHYHKVPKAPLAHKNSNDLKRGLVLGLFKKDSQIEGYFEGEGLKMARLTKKKTAHILEGKVVFGAAYIRNLMV